MNNERWEDQARQRSDESLVNSGRATVEEESGRLVLVLTEKGMVSMLKENERMEKVKELKEYVEKIISEIDILDTELTTLEDSDSRPTQDELRAKFHPSVSEIFKMHVSRVSNRCYELGANPGQAFLDDTVNSYGKLNRLLESGDFSQARSVLKTARRAYEVFLR